jgi:nonspecific dipeptidase
VSAWLHKRAELRKIVDWIQVRMQKLKIHVELQELGQQSFQDGKVADLPPVVFGLLGTDPKKKTVLIYGHLDVQPALVEDGWNSDPFVLTERLDKLYGRGASDDKGPVLCWLHAVEAYQHLGIDIPVNIKFVFEAMEESGSVRLKELLLSEKDKFLADVDYVCVSDTCWLGTNKPCVAYGLRGVCYFYIEVESATKDLHSGLFGGSV